MRQSTVTYVQRSYDHAGRPLIRQHQVLVATLDHATNSPTIEKEQHTPKTKHPNPHSHPHKHTSPTPTQLHDP